MSDIRQIRTPLTEDVVRSLHIADVVALTGVVYQARDAAHRRFAALLEAGEELPFDLSGAVIYYVGPAPAPPGAVIGSAGPTTSGRMDAYTPLLLRRGLRGMIGKGFRSPAVKRAMRDHPAVYFAATGGAGALLARHIIAAETIAYPEFGAEACARLEVVEFPAVVAVDCHGGDLYEEGRRRYSRPQVATPAP